MRCEFLDLVQAATVADFDDDPGTVKALVAAASTGQFEHAAQRARDERERTQRRQAFAAELGERGITVLGADADATPLHRLTDAEAARAQRRDVIESNKAWRAAEPVRREWLRGLLARKTPPKGSAALVAAALACDADTVTRIGGNHRAAELLGCEDTTYGRNSALAVLIDRASEPRARPLGLAVVLARYEDATHTGFLAPRRPRDAGLPDLPRRVRVHPGRRGTPGLRARPTTRDLSHYPAGKPQRPPRGSSSPDHPAGAYGSRAHQARESRLRTAPRQSIRTVVP